MRFQTSGKFEQGVADVDPVTLPGSLLQGHIFVLPETLPGVNAPDLWIALIGSGSETVTLTLYFLIDETSPYNTDVTRYINSNHKWFQFASGVVVTNGTLQIVSAGAGVPSGGVVYARRTADTITAGQTRTLVAAWT